MSTRFSKILTSPLVAVLFLALLVFLAFFQYRWLGRVSDAELETTRRGLTAAARGFSEHFDRELTALLLQMAPAMEGAGDHREGLSDRWRAWAESTDDVEFVKDLFLVPRRSETRQVFRWTPESEEWEATPWPAELAELADDSAGWKQRVRRLPPDESQGEGGRRGRRPPQLFLAPRVPALVLPLRNGSHQHSTAQTSAARHLEFCLVRLDVEFLKKQYFPRLAQLYFADTDGNLQVDVEIRHGDKTIFHQSQGALDGKQPSANADASADLFSLLPPPALEKSGIELPAWLAAAGREPWWMARDGSRAGRRLRGDERGARRSRRNPEGRAPQDSDAAAGDTAVGANRQRVRNVAPARLLAQRHYAALAAAMGPGHWQVQVRHPRGSLEAAVAAARRRNFAVSLGILLLLGGSLLMMQAVTRRAERLAKQQLGFIAGVTHELMTPLAAVRSAGQNLAHGVVEDPSKVQRYGRMIEKESLRLSEMMQQVLTYAGFEARGEEIRDPQPVDFGQCIAAALTACGPAIEEAGVQVEVDVPKVLPPVLGDAHALERAIANLIQNGVKYGGGARWLGVSARQIEAGGGRPRLQVEVRDRGAGIAPEDLPHVTEPFFRGGAVVSSPIPGSGLGLSLVQQIVEAHGGRLKIDSTPGEGTTVQVELPLENRQ